jgi:hypothetical protein
MTTTTKTLETLTAELLAADAAWNTAIATKNAASAPGNTTPRAEKERLYNEAQARRAEYEAARSAFVAAGGDLDTLPE